MDILSLFVLVAMHHLQFIHVDGNVNDRLSAQIHVFLKIIEGHLVCSKETLWAAAIDGMDRLLRSGNGEFAELSSPD
jgi:hypothetical protein